jgi:hypothetical protein
MALTIRSQTSLAGCLYPSGHLPLQSAHCQRGAVGPTGPAGLSLLRPVRQTSASCAHLGGCVCCLCGERAAASVAARPPSIAVSGGGWPLRSVAINSR